MDQLLIDQRLIDQPLPAVAVGHMLELVGQGRPGAAFIYFLASFDLVHAHTRPSTLRSCRPFLRDVATYLLYFQNHLLPIPRVLRPLFATSPDIVIETIFYMRLLGMGMVANAARGGTPREGRGQLVRRLARISDNCLLGQWVTLCVVRLSRSRSTCYCVCFIPGGGGRGYQ
ncbi:hypothetical protein IMZ48_25860, partial [Candidatus Bathyarchaeota archaeon]|nr:hypothetical protein [Candidatus Bathyarchaeota archaeon]